MSAGTAYLNIKRSTLEISRDEFEYAIPADLVRGKQKVTVRFQAASESEIAPVFGLRMIRKDGER